MLEHYGKKYFEWQSSIGEFGGWANLTKFNKYINENDIVLDFGCGGGYLLENILCNKKIGIEVNPNAIKEAREKGIEVFEDISKVPNNSIDVIISNHALEHVREPLKSLIELKDKLKKDGKVVFVVPCESISKSFDPENVNYHLYSWSPVCLGNLFTEAGYKVVESKPYIHKWPPKYKTIAKYGGRKLFNFLSKIYARLERSWFQVRVVATK